MAAEATAKDAVLVWSCEPRSERYVMYEMKLLT